MGIFQRLFGGGAAPRPPEENPYLALRQRALDVTAEALQLAPAPAAGAVFGVLMEYRVSDTIVSLVTFTDGSASLYFSTGGGVIGGGEHPSVRDVVVRFIQFSGQFLRHATPAPDTQPPAAGQLQFLFKLHPGALHRIAAAETAMQAGGHPASPLYLASQDVITQLRLASGHY